MVKFLNPQFPHLQNRLSIIAFSLHFCNDSMAGYMCNGSALVLRLFSSQSILAAIIRYNSKWFLWHSGESELQGVKFVHRSIIGMLLGRLYRPQMVLSAFQEN